MDIDKNITVEADNAEKTGKNNPTEIETENEDKNQITADQIKDKNQITAEQTEDKSRTGKVDNTNELDDSEKKEAHAELTNTGGNYGDDKETNMTEK